MRIAQDARNNRDKFCRQSARAAEDAVLRDTSAEPSRGMYTSLHRDQGSKKGVPCREITQKWRRGEKTAGSYERAAGDEHGAIHGGNMRDRGLPCAAHGIVAIAGTVLGPPGAKRSASRRFKRKSAAFSEDGRKRQHATGKRCGDFGVWSCRGSGAVAWHG